MPTNATARMSPKVYEDPPSSGASILYQVSSISMNDAPAMHGRFVDDGGETWYRIDGYDRAPPFFVALASDSDVWAFVSTAGSLAAGRRDAEGAFFPYETVDRISWPGCQFRRDIAAVASR